MLLAKLFGAASSNATKLLPSAVVATTSARNRSFRKVKHKIRLGIELGGPKDWGYNFIEKKDGFLKPVHTVEEQMEYMRSDVFHETYKNRPIWAQWRRNIKGPFLQQPPPRLFCIDRNGRFNVSQACPVCRDEYLFFDFRNPELIEHFILAGTDVPLTILRTGLCQEQYMLLKAEIIKAKERGTMTFNVPFRHYDYAEWYSDASAFADPDDYAEQRPSRNLATVEDTYNPPDHGFPSHNRDVHTRWNQWWIRVDKFAKRMK